MNFCVVANFSNWMSSPFSSFTGFSTSPLRFGDLSPMGYHPLDYRNPLTDDSPKSLTGSVIQSDQSVNDLCSNDTSIQECIEDDRQAIDSLVPVSEISEAEYSHLHRSRPWEHVPLSEVNYVPRHAVGLEASWDIQGLSMGPLRHILRFYMQKAIQSIPQASVIYQDVARVLVEGTDDLRLLEQAKALGMLPLAIRLHMQFTKLIQIPMEHISFLVFRREECSRRISGRLGPDDDVDMSIRESIVYYPGIELKLGKERDTLIRPTLTSIFREYRDVFKTALQEQGLRYGDLRMWKDAQLCTAIHVADAFRPGIWAKAVDLHVKKTASSRSRRRQQRRRSIESRSMDLDTRSI